MSHILYWFPDPSDSKATLTSDAGFATLGVPIVHPTGREGLGFTIPDGIPSGWGARILTEHENKVPVNIKGILYLNDYGSALLAVDDVTLQDKPSTPPIPEPIPPGEAKSPIELIRQVYNSGDYEFVTKEGCGLFTEDCCKALHEQQSNRWGHVHKNDNQNGYPPLNTPEKKKHSIDAIMILTDYVDGYGDLVAAGTYDIIKNAETMNGEPAFNRVDDIHPELWFYPA